MEHINGVFKIINPNKNTYLVVIKINNDTKNSSKYENIFADFADFSEKMPNYDKKEYKILHHQTKKQEFLAGRFALLKALELLEYEYKGIKKDENGKPYLIDYQENNQQDNNQQGNQENNIHISLTHSYPFACALASRLGACGVDIEAPKEKILRVAPRVFSENECAFLQKDLQKNTVFWCAKEVLYKIYGKGEVNFKENLFISPFKDETEIKVVAEIKMPDFQQKYVLDVAFLEDFVLCYGVSNCELPQTRIACEDTSNG